MGLKNTIIGRQIYLDSNIFIYSVEQHPIFSDVVKQIFKNIDDGHIEAVTSDLTLAEVLVKPCEKNLDRQKETYIDVITGTPSLEAVTVTREIFIQAAEMRARTGMKLPDAIHVTTSVEKGCDVFITNDAGIKTPENITRLLLSDWVDK